ncbi:unnamed protein product [Larinioides sclopetarius]|uniref:Uncharacterized protein n=1 Tax=Larinioides sclopetarius TaxID=280406 RepID=A0AAV2B4Y9_9ARAC
MNQICQEEREKKKARKRRKEMKSPQGDVTAVPEGMQKVDFATSSGHFRWSSACGSCKFGIRRAVEGPWDLYI